MQAGLGKNILGLQYTAIVKSKFHIFKNGYFQSFIARKWYARSINFLKFGGGREKFFEILGYNILFRSSLESNTLILGRSYISSLIATEGQYTEQNYPLFDNIFRPDVCHWPAHPHQKLIT